MSVRDRQTMTHIFGERMQRVFVASEGLFMCARVRERIEKVHAQTRERHKQREGATMRSRRRKLCNEGRGSFLLKAGV